LNQRVSTIKKKMKIQLKLSPNIQPVPFNHLHQLVGGLHKWLGPNEEHGQGLSLYSFGWLQGGEKIGRSLHFPHGATLDVSFFDEQRGWELAKGILKDPTWNYGMRVLEANEMPIPGLGERSRFQVSSPVMLRERRTDGSRRYILWDEADHAEEALTRIFRKKMQVAGVSGPHLESRMRFAPANSHPKTKLVHYRQVKHKSSICPIEVEGTPEAALFAWLTGAGESTGSGFGALV